MFHTTMCRHSNSDKFLSALFRFWTNEHVHSSCFAFPFFLPIINHIFKLVLIPIVSHCITIINSDCHFKSLSFFEKVNLYRFCKRLYVIVYVIVCLAKRLIVIINLFPITCFLQLAMHSF